jgi:hypothetical protein
MYSDHINVFSQLNLVLTCKLVIELLAVIILLIIDNKSTAL